MTNTREARVLAYDNCVTGHHMKLERYRMCAVCGNRHGPTYGFQAMLERLGVRGVWAAPGCIAKLISLREAERRSHPANIDPN
jgi:hypothetical protein